MYIIGLPLILRLHYRKTADGTSYKQLLKRDGGVYSMLSGEKGTGFRCTDKYPDTETYSSTVGVGPL